MRNPAFFVAAAFLLVSMAIAQAQGTEQTRDAGNGVGGTASTGTGVKTGHGPNMQPGPAVGTMNPPYNSNRPMNRQGGPTLTHPPKHPFGTSNGN